MNISELPQEIKELALLRQQECIYTTHDKGTDNLCLAFDWSKTKEGLEYWEEYYWKEAVIIEPKNIETGTVITNGKVWKSVEEITDIIEKKIATMSSRGFESYYLPIGILKDLIREIKEIK